MSDSKMSQDQQSSTDSVFRKLNLDQRLEELIAYNELLKLPQRRLREAKQIALKDQSCNTTTIIQGECRNHPREENTSPESNDYCIPISPASADIKEKSTFVINNLNRPFLNESRKCFSSTSVDMDLNKIYLAEDNFTQPNSVQISQIDSELTACKDLPNSSFYQNENIANVAPCCSKNTHNCPIFLNNTNEFTEPYLNVNQNTKQNRMFAEKMTYCRPVISIHNQKLIYKMLQRNAKLQVLVKKIVLAREKEKHNEAWNNYINELKNKHRYNDIQQSKVKNLLVTDDKNSCIIDDCYEPKDSWEESDYCLLSKDFCRATHENSSREIIHKHRGCLHPPCKSYKYSSNAVCFPTSSQAAISMLSRRKNQHEHHTMPNAKFRVITLPKKSKQGRKSKTKMPQPVFEKENTIGKHTSISVQTKVEINSTKAIQMSDVNVADYNKQVERKEKCVSCDEKQSSFSGIPNKLDTLIDRFNSFVEELKSNKHFENKSEDGVLKTKSDTYNALTPIVFRPHRKNQRNDLIFSKCSNKWQNSIDEILEEEIGKSNKVKKDLDKILCNNGDDCDVKITDDIPTKEHFVEINNTLYENKEHDMIDREVERETDGTDISKCITVAVNTDPLGLLALLRISTAAMKQVLSYMPNIAYVFNLPRLYTENVPAASSITRFICNICGASFARPSQLSDHIQKHNLANTRSCCVCRDVLNRHCHCARLFACTYCGQMFTRAYCRQLHEQTCCKNLRRCSITNLALLT